MHTDEVCRKECTSENTKAFTEIHAIRRIYFKTKFEMINVVSSKMVKNMLLRSL